MRVLFLSTLTSLAALVGVVVAGGLPRNVPTGIQLAANTSTPSEPLTQVIGNASLLFAWQLVGGAPNQTFLHSLCANFPNISGTWAAEGLNTTLIKDVIDSNDRAPPDPVAAQTQVSFYNTEIFVTQILSVASQDSRFFGPMCNNMSSELLSSATLNGTRVQTAVCDAAGLPVPPADPAGGSPETAIQIVQDASLLYGWEAIGMTNSSSTLNYYCRNINKVGQNLSQLGLYISEVQEVYCNNANNPPPPAQGKQEIVYYTTNVFLMILLHISEDDGYFQFLCSNLSVPAMNAIGLDGGRVSSQVCSIEDSR